MSATSISLDELFDLTPNKDVNIDFRHDHRLYETLHDILLVKSAIGIAMGAVLHGGLIDTNGKTLSLKSNHFNKSVFFYLNNVFQLAVQNKKPDRISIAVSEIYARSDQPLVATHGFDGVVNRPLTLPIAAFFERYLPFMRSLSSDCYQWPEPFNFCRVVRNAVAHGGTLNIENPNAPPVTWRGISFSHGDHLKPLISERFNMAELILLLIDADSTLERLEAKP